MIEIRGEHNKANCYAVTVEDAAIEQIKAVCDRPEFADSKLRIMPDAHSGKGCTIGTTMTLTDKVVPGMVGVDIGCGMETVKLKETEIDFEKLDRVIRKHIPFGREVRDTPHRLSEEIRLEELRCADRVGLPRAYRSIGSLGGGNHFIEIDRNGKGELYLVIHSGSRHLGTEVADYYQNVGYKTLCDNAKDQLRAKIDELKSQGRDKEIYDALKALKATSKTKLDIPKDLAYVEGELFENYIHDMKITQRFAQLNRQAMTEVILSEMGLREVERFTTVHNYIDTREMILRKGAVSAKAGEKLLIPINMRDGSLICIGKGNEDWNCSAPHGAGRLMSRHAAMAQLDMEEYAQQMKDVFTTCVSRQTLDEAPMAYKNMDEIMSAITPTAEIVEIIKPVYNFKASE